MSHSPSNRAPLEILLVEDHPGDALLVQENFKRGRCPVNLSHVENGEECLRFLEKAGPYAQAPTPQLLLVDLDLPVMNGLELMEILLADTRFRHLPFVVLTTVADERWIQEMYALRCSTYILKPWTFDELQGVIDKVSCYWSGVATLPKAVA